VTRVGVLGAAGRMGRTVCRAVLEDPDLELVAALDPRIGEADWLEVGDDGTRPLLGTGVEDLQPAGAQVAVDFTVADAAERTMRWCAANGVHAVVGTTGMSRQAVSELGELFRSSEANCVIAPNFAIGAVLMMRFAEMAALHMDGAEIVELHHDQKLDAPSGTAMTSATRMAAARQGAGRGPWPSDRTTTEVAECARGADATGGVRVHSVRLPGLVAHQEVVLGAPGQSLTIRHDAYDRTSFMPGVLLAIKSVSTVDGLVSGLEGLLHI
jgi:4-hydroxy-tetrahydrodipicolinate reductase